MIHPRGFCLCGWDETAPEGSPRIDPRRDFPGRHWLHLREELERAPWGKHRRGEPRAVAPVPMRGGDRSRNHLPAGGGKRRGWRRDDSQRAPGCQRECGCGDLMECGTSGQQQAARGGKMGTAFWEPAGCFRASGLRHGCAVSDGSLSLQSRLPREAGTTKRFQVRDAWTVETSASALWTGG